MNGPRPLAVTSDLAGNDALGTAFVVATEPGGAFLVTSARVLDAVGGPDNARIDERPILVHAAGDATLDLALIYASFLKDDIARLGRLAVGRRVRLRGYRRRVGGHDLSTIEGYVRRALDGDDTPQASSWELALDGGGPIEPGYAGAAVVDVETGRVGGIVTRPDGRVGHATCLDVLALRQLRPSPPAIVGDALPRETARSKVTVEPGQAPSYYCYVARGEVDALAREPAVVVPPTAEIPYGRPDVFLGRRALRAEYAQKLASVLGALPISRFPWRAEALQAGRFYGWSGLFHASVVDPNVLVASLETNHADQRLILHCAMAGFSDQPVEDGTVRIHSTNRSFFDDGLALWMEAVFVIRGAAEGRFFASPLYLKTNTREVIL